MLRNTNLFRVANKKCNLFESQRLVGQNTSSHVNGCFCTSLPFYRNNYGQHMSTPWYLSEHQKGFKPIQNRRVALPFPKTYPVYLFGRFSPTASFSWKEDRRPVEIKKYLKEALLKAEGLSGFGKEKCPFLTADLDCFYYVYRSFSPLGIGCILTFVTSINMRETI